MLCGELGWSNTLEVQLHVELELTWTFTENALKFVLPFVFFRNLLFSVSMTPVSSFQRPRFELTEQIRIDLVFQK